MCSDIEALRHEHDQLLRDEKKKWEGEGDRLRDEIEVMRADQSEREKERFELVTKVDSLQVHVSNTLATH